MVFIAKDPKWWKEVTVYQKNAYVITRHGTGRGAQIYPASFKDSNGDGLGDIPGIISKLDYIHKLGVDVIWLSPHYKSPQIDLGYDIEDYKDIHEPYGTVADCETLIREAHARGIKLLFDLVINHTSDRHAWFKESRSSKDNPKRDWYIWRPAKYVDGKRHPPCNWMSAFGGSVWQWDDLTQEYYLHLFTPEQPDLNWESAEVRQAIYADSIHFWLQKGVDGFRIDTVNMYSKFLDFPDAPIETPDAEFQRADMYFSNGPRLHEFLKEMNLSAFSKYDCMTVGECPNTYSFRKMLPFVGEDAKELDMVIEFEISAIDHGREHFPLLAYDWPLTQLKDLTKESQHLVDPEYKAWATNYLENHDQARSVSRFGNDSEEYRIPSAKLLATYLLTLSGTPFIYEGEEIGMINAPKDWDISEFKDVGTINFWKEVEEIAPEHPGLLERSRQGIQLVARDHSRTPMQWNSTPQAGFTAPTSKPWMRVMDSYTTINVELQDDDPDSVLNYYRTLLKLRKEYKLCFIHGKFESLRHEDEKVFTYLKRQQDDFSKAILVVLNFSSDVQSFEFPDVVKSSKLILGNLKESQQDQLAAWESRIYVVEVEK